MSYFEIVNLVFWIVWGLYSLLCLHFLVFTLIGIFCKKKTFPHTEKKLKYAVVVSARNEEKVIGKLIDSIRACDYPQELVEIFICAHNCTDRTAEVARAKGAHVYEYNNPDECTLGYAYHYMIAEMNKDFPENAFDGILVMNADNLVSRDYLTRMNDAYVANGEKSVIVSMRNSTNFGSNYMSCLYGLFFLSICRYEMRGRTRCGCSTRVSGTGFLYPKALVKDGWPYVSITEDWEFTADRVAHGTRIVYCDEAEFYDEQPTTVPVMWRQRLRWARGHMVVFFTRWKALLKYVFTPRKKGEEKKHRGSALDIAVAIMPLGVIAIAIAILQLLCMGLLPLFQTNYLEIWKNYLILSAIKTGISYLGLVLSAVFLMFLERKHIQNVGFGVRLAAVLLWPVFLLIAALLDVIVLFKKNVIWKPIPHEGKSTVILDRIEAEKRESPGEGPAEGPEGQIPEPVSEEQRVS